MVRLYGQSLAYLKSLFSNDLEKWMAYNQRGFAGFEREHAIGVVNLARLTRTPTLLPVAFLMCLNLESAVVRGCAREDGSREHLTTDDLCVFIDAQKRFLKANISATLSVLAVTAPAACKDLATCGPALRRSRLTLKGKVPNLLVFDVAAPHYSRCFRTGDWEKLCSNCKARLEARWNQKARAIWNRLPEILGIDVPGWAPSAPSTDAEQAR